MVDKLPKNVIRWYSNNVACNDKRVVAIPIGFVYNMEREEHLLTAKRVDKDGLLYVCFTRWPKPRAGLYEHFGQYDWVTMKGGTAFDSVPAPEYYTDLSRHYYVLSPPGAGPDCHRHWESIYMLSTPVVLPHQADILQGCPHLVVNDWSEVTKELLRSHVPTKTYNCLEKVTIDYWRDRIERDYHENT
jgi:hypothetical protein